MFCYFLVYNFEYFTSYCVYKILRKIEHDISFKNEMTRWVQEKALCYEALNMQ